MNQEQQPFTVNDIQHLHFELLRRVNYNLLDGEKVVQDLLDWHDLWYSAIATRLPLPLGDQTTHTHLSLLRTTHGNYWPVDTLYIWTNDEAVIQLQQRIKERWQPDEVEVLLPDVVEMTYAHLDDEHDRVLFVWWD